MTDIASHHHLNETENEDRSSGATIAKNDKKRMNLEKELELVRKQLR